MNLALFALLLFAQTVFVAEGKLEKVFDGGVFTEGPAAAPDGTIYFSDITGSRKSREAGHILRFDPRTGKTVIYRSPSGMANGLVFDLDGKLVAAEGADFGGRRVTRTDMASGRAERVATHFDGKLLNSPNDITVDAKNRIWFTDPRYVGDEPVEQPLKAVYRIDGDRSIHLVVRDAVSPNGLAISPDQKTLYVADTGKEAIVAYDIAPDGSTSNGRTLFQFEKGGYADGITVDRAGNIYCGCGPTGVRAWSPAGKEIGRIVTPAPATNVEFGRGAERRILYVTAGGALYRVRTGAEGFHPGD